MTIPSRLTVDQLDDMFQTATYVERYLPNPSIKPKRKIGILYNLEISPIEGHLGSLKGSFSPIHMRR